MSDVKLFVNFFKFVFLEPCIVEQVIHQEVQNLRGSAHYLIDTFEPLAEGVHVLNERLASDHSKVLGVLDHRANVKHEDYQRLFYGLDHFDFFQNILYLVDDRVDRVSHFMRYRSVNEREQVVFGECLVVKDLFRNVYNLD